MIRSILCGLLAVASVGALATIPLACKPAGIGDPCTPEDEYRSNFGGFKLSEENIESRAFQCATRICLVNHFQGRVSCPAGQKNDIIKNCDPSASGNDGSNPACASGEKCVESETLAPECDPAVPTSCSGVQGTACDKTRKICSCTPGGAPGPEGYFCSSDKTFKTFLCHKENNCQAEITPGNDAQGNDEATQLKNNKGKQCCIPGTDTPVGVPVCGQCNSAGFRNAINAVYCSCRCLPEGQQPDEKDKNFNFCTCPSGFKCEEIRKFVGLGDPNLAGSYCIKENSKYQDENQCGNVVGNADAADNCKGLEVN